MPTISAHVQTSRHRNVRYGGGGILIHPTLQISLRQYTAFLVIDAFGGLEAPEVGGDEGFAFTCTRRRTYLSAHSAAIELVDMIGK